MKYLLRRYPGLRRRAARPAKKLLKPAFLLGLAPVALLAWAGRGLPLRQVWETLAGLSAGQVLALIGLNAAIFGLLSGRWWLLLRAQGYPVPFLSLAGYRLAAFGVTYFTPGPQLGGEPLQVHLTRKRNSVPGGAAVAAVTIDKLLELQANFTFLVFGIAIVLQGGFFGTGWGFQALLLGISLLLLPILYSLALWSGRRPAAWLAARVPSRAGRVRRAQELAGAAEGAVGEFFRCQPRVLLRAGALSALIWAAMLAEYWLTLHFLGLRFDAVQTVSALTAARLAFLLPIPAGLGVLEASQVLAIQALGASAALGISASLLIRARDLTLAGLGLWLGTYLVRRNKPF